MKRLLFVVGLVVLLAGGPVGVSAQSGGDADACSADGVAASIAAAQELLADAQVAAGAGDVAAALALSEDANAVLASMTEDCAVLLAPPLCESYPQFCVPRAGGPTVAGQTLEAPEAEPVLLSQGAAGVVRGVNGDRTLFIGDPDAPVHILEFSDFACPHCISYHEETLGRLFEDAVLTGRATFEMRPLAFVAGAFSQDAAYAMLCAAEQGAAWEMHDALYEGGRTLGASRAYSLDGLGASATALGLDAEALVGCVQSGRYADALAVYRADASTLNVTGTPTVLVRIGTDGAWVTAARDYDSLMALIADAE